MTHTPKTVQTAPAANHLSELAFGPVELSVGDLGWSLAFYRQTFGLEVLERSEHGATLGAGGAALLTLHERPGARPAPPSAPGLYHLALLLPNRADLARWVKHAAHLNVRLGQADHLVSEAFYLSDPDGHGIEIYRDRPRHAWNWNANQIRMANNPVDISGLLNEPGAEKPFTGLPPGTTLGHIHLRVTDMSASESFYQHALGLNVTARWPGALFMSIDGYHHHIGLNTWQSQGGAPAPDSAAKLERVHLTLAGQGHLDQFSERLGAAGIAFTADEHGLELQDPSNNPLRFTIRER